MVPYTTPNITRLCSAEEEAAACAHGVETGNLDVVGTASTWTLERLQSLAAEARGLCPATPSAMQVIDAVNTVLYDRHGYRCRDIVGDPRHTLLNRVMETGLGTSASLAILYMDLCHRLGMHMTAAVLDTNYVVCWPCQPSVLSACGERFVVDPYSQGALFAAEEVVELFDLGSLAQLDEAAVSNRRLVATCLHDLQLAYYAAAVLSNQREDEFNNVMALDLEDVLAGRFPVNSGELSQFFLQRTAAAAERRAALVSEDADAALDEALALYVVQRYREARARLEAWVARHGDAAVPLLDKCRLLCALQD